MYKRQVEDEKEICDGVAIYLKNQGYNVFKANNGIEGLEIIEKEDIHLALCLLYTSFKKCFCKE